MTIQCDHSDLMTILNNNNTICQAVIEFGTTTASDIHKIPDAMIRLTELLMQVVKSNSAIINSITERNRV
jgi:hypothetical protein